MPPLRPLKHLDPEATAVTAAVAATAEAPAEVPAEATVEARAAATAAPPVDALSPSCAVATESANPIAEMKHLTRQMMILCWNNVNVDRFR
jgi:hypothetical protein